MKIDIEWAADLGFEKLANGSALRISSPENFVGDPATTEGVIIPALRDTPRAVLRWVGCDNRPNFISV